MTKDLKEAKEEIERQNWLSNALLKKRKTPIPSAKPNIHTDFSGVQKLQQHGDTFPGKLRKNQRCLGLTSDFFLSQSCLKSWTFGKNHLK